jgi:hypothetical protein
MRTEATNIGTSVGSRDGFQTGPPKGQQRFYREYGENTLALCRGQLFCPLAAAVPPPCLPLTKGRQVWWVEIAGYKRVIP